MNKSMYCNDCDGNSETLEVCNSPDLENKVTVAMRWWEWQCSFKTTRLGIKQGIQQSPESWKRQGDVLIGATAVRE